MLGAADAMIGYPVLGEVVCADFLGAVAGADLGEAGITVFALFVFEFLGEQAGAQYAHGFELVFELGFFVLAGDDQAGGNVCDAYGRVGSVDGLAAVAAGAVNIDTQVLVADFDIGFFGFGEDGDGDRGGVDAAL